MSTTDRTPGGAVQDPVRLWLRLEALTFFVLATYLYARSEASWGVFALLFLAPDVSFAGYLAGPRVGAMLYNVVHSYVAPLLLAVALLAVDGELALVAIWAAHIALDRALGYGLKYPSGFGDTHLGRVGKPARTVVEVSATR